MASSRHNMRKSRRTSPLNTSGSKSTASKNEARLGMNTENLSDEWAEPPVRAPVPSFEDYKGLERHGVLEHMAPLGSLPNSKVRARSKQHEPSRRTLHLKNGELKGAREDVSTPEPAPPVAARRSEPRNTEERVTRVSSSKERDEDLDYTPTLKGSTKAVLAKPASTHPVFHSPVSSRTAQGRHKLKQIVDSAVSRSNELGDPVLGNAVKELYTESLRNPLVADLLDAVLTQKPSSAQTAEFQSRIKAARKKHREHQASQNISSKAMSNSPAAKSARSSVTRHFDTTKISSSPTIFNSHPPNANHRSNEREPDTTELNGSPSKDERPSKRMKRSKSTSSDSSLLSSVDSAIDDEEFPPTISPSAAAISNHALNQKVPQTKALPSNGPKLGTFPLRTTDSSSRRPVLLQTTSSSQTDDVAAKKREEYRLKYNQYVGAPQESAVRGSPSPLYSSQSTPPILATSKQNRKGNLRNGTSKRRGKDDHEALDSPGSSNFGEASIPPPLGLSRAATPNQLGRPPKGFRKAARIKMS